MCGKQHLPPSVHKRNHDAAAPFDETESALKHKKKKKSRTQCHSSDVGDKKNIEQCDWAVNNL